MITIIIDVTNATDEEKAKIHELYKKPINQLSKEATIFYQDDKAEKKWGSGIGFNKTLISFQSIEDFSDKNIENKSQQNMQ